jgi:hypothetical protein
MGFTGDIFKLGGVGISVKSLSLGEQSFLTCVIIDHERTKVFPESTHEP